MIRVDHGMGLILISSSLPGSQGQSMQPVLMEMKEVDSVIVSLIDLMNPLPGIITLMRQYFSASWVLLHQLIR